MEEFAIRFRNFQEESSSLIQVENPQCTVDTVLPVADSEEVLRESSSKGSLCLEIGNLKVKGAVGRPRKQSKKKKNPFDFANLGIKTSCKKVCHGKLYKGPFHPSFQRKHISKLEIIQESKVINKMDKTRSIVNCAQTLGLQVNMDISITIKEVSQELQEGIL